MKAFGLVKNRLTIMNVIILMIGALGLMSVAWLARSIHLHELNFVHLKHSADFSERLATADLSDANQREDLRAILINVRQQPIDCLENTNFVDRLGAMLVGTRRAFELCADDIDVASRGLEILNMLETEAIEPRVAAVQLSEFAHEFSENSVEFSPLVSRTVDAILFLVAGAIVIASVSCLLITLLVSKSILRQFDRSYRMETELNEKNVALNQSVERLERQKAEIDEAKKLAEWHALHDPLTGLANRRFLDQTLDQMIDRDRPIGVLHVDIDRFKQINDTLGHETGDFILAHVAETLRSITRGDDFVARVGGDEFVVLAEIESHHDMENEVSRLSERILAHLVQPVCYDQAVHRVSVSIGIAIGTPKETPVRQLLVNADVALYRAKVMGRARYEFFDNAMRVEIIQRKQLGDGIMAGLEKNEFVPFYQPQFCVKTLNIVGMEALVRWNHPEQGLLSPSSFLEIAQDLKVLSQIDHRILCLALDNLQEWDRMGLQIPKLSVNVSSGRLRDPRLMSDLRALNIPRERISFELLESIFLDEADSELKWIIDGLREMDINIELDDFGSGFASILGLLQLKPKQFKMDRQLIQKIDQDDTKRALVRSIIDIGKSLDMQVVAEGVESIAHADILCELGCDFLQGFAFAKPMPFEEVQSFIESNSWRSAA